MERRKKKFHDGRKHPNNLSILSLETCQPLYSVGQTLCTNVGLFPFLVRALDVFGRLIYTKVPTVVRVFQSVAVAFRGLARPDSDEARYRGHPPAPCYTQVSCFSHAEHNVTVVMCSVGTQAVSRARP
jgi:hypothetical protein